MNTVLVVLWSKDGIYSKLFILINADCSREAYVNDFPWNTIGGAMAASMQNPM
jgi:hypothetical protein